ncbi:MAG: tetratricopeptide repeat protein [Acidobacteria bacterium]|nr:tetratricopeptide repeat protein [Acidobacteriota bacterium]
MKRAGRLTVLSLVALGFVAAGIVYVPSPDEAFVVTRSFLGGSPRLEAPGLKWSVPLLSRHHSYRASPFPVEISVGRTGGAGAASREGAGIQIAMRLRLAPDPESFRALDSVLGSAYRDPGRLAEIVAGPLRAVAAASAYDALLSLEPGTRATMVAAARRAVSDAGMRLTDVDALEIWPRAEFAPAESASPEARRVLLIGLDGADWQFVDPLIAAGKMPRLAALVASGVRARLKTVEPVLSPIIWTSIATGKRPEKHGILDFLATDSRTGASIPVTSSMRKARAFWGMLSSRGISVGTIAWWASWPAEPVLGFQVTDRVAYQVFSGAPSGEGLRGRTYPEPLVLSLSAQTGAAREAAGRDAAELLGRPAGAETDEQELLSILTSTRIYHRAALALMREYRPRVMAVYYEGTDTVAHLFMRYAPPRLPGVRAEDVARWGMVTERYYLLQDRLLGEILDAAGPDASVMVVSDHGFRSGSGRPQTDPRIGIGAAADWHRKFGIFAASGPGFRSGAVLEDLSVLDVTPTLLALLDQPAARDMDGVVATAALDRAAGRPVPEPIPSYEALGEWRRPADEASGRGEAQAAVDREMIAKLTALGYIGQTGPNAENNTGLTLLRQGRHEEAVHAFREALRNDPDFVQARINLARALMSTGDSAGALENLLAVQARDPNAPDVDNLLGNIHLDRGELSRAETTFRRALDRDERNPNLWNSLGIVLDREGRGGEAIAAYRRVVAIDGDYAEAINNIGLVLRSQGRVAEAIAQFEAAKKADADFPGSYNNLGLMYQDAGDPNAAIAAYDEGLRVDPENPIILNNRGSVLMALGRTEEAKAMFSRAIVADPNYPSAHNNLGAALAALGDEQGEFDAYLKAIDLDPNYVDARFNLALNLSRRRRPDEALRTLDALLKISPAHARALAQRALLLAQAGKTAEALVSAEKASAATPRWTFARNLYARLLAAAGRREEALREARMSLSLDPNQPDVESLLRELTATIGSKP